MKKSKKNLKKLLIILEVIIVLAAIWFGTVFLQKSPKYPFAKTNLDKYYDEYVPNYTVSKEGLIQDVDSMVNYTDELHADPYRMISKEELLQKAEDIKSEINSDSREKIPAIDAFYYLQELAAFIQDGHTILFPWNWEKMVDSIFLLKVTSVEGKIFVDKNYGNNSIPVRAEIIAVNEIVIEQMKKDMMKYVSATLEGFKETEFAKRFILWIQTYYRMQSPWNVTYKYNGVTKTITIEGISKDSKGLPQTGLDPELEKDYVESDVEVNGEKIPVIEFLAFGNGEWEDFKAYIDNFFNKNKDKKYLIVDLRHIPGGLGDWGYYVLSYLTSNMKGFKEFSIRINQEQKKIIQYFFQKAYFDMKISKFLWNLPLYKPAKQDDPYYYIGRDILESKLNTTYYSKWEYEKSYLANESANRLKGKVFLLTSHETFSAGAGFGGLFKSNSLGTIVGQETGGRVYMESDQRPVMLPNSNLLYFIPTFKYILSDDNPDRGVMPDYPVELTVKDYINGKDTDMEKVSELIKEDMGK